MTTERMLLLAVLVATLVVLGLIMWPLFLLLPTPAMRAVLLAPLYAVVADVAMQQLDRPGTLVLFALVLGFVLLIFSPLLLPVGLVAAMGAEICGYVVGSLKGAKPWVRLPLARRVGAALFPALHFPVMLLALGLAGGVDSFRSWVVVAITAAGVVLGLGGCWLAQAVTRRIAKKAI